MPQHQRARTPALVSRIQAVSFGEEWCGRLLVHVRHVIADHAFPTLSSSTSSGSGPLGHVLCWLRLNQPQLLGATPTGREGASFEHTSMDDAAWSALKADLCTEVAWLINAVEHSTTRDLAALTTVMNQRTRAAFSAEPVVRLLQVTA